MREAVIKSVRKEIEEIKAIKERSKSARWKVGTLKKGGSVAMTAQDTDPLDERLAFLEGTIEDMEKGD